MNNKIISIIGPDGVGKTTQIELLISKLNEKGLRYESKWLRFNHFFSLPLLALARFMGLSEIITLESGNRLGYHYFYRSRAISALYAFLLLADTMINTFFKVYIPVFIFRRNIIYDRFIYDTMVDLMVSTGNMSETYSTLFSGLIPRKSISILLITDTETLRQRRDDVMYDKALEQKINRYHQLSEKFNIPTVDANQPVENVHKELLRKVGC
ncbi:MAG: thymidylate kinase [Candidatus Methanofastidiosum methylothiophilum]|uniref:Thymidylate kinase n=1 Tax=Candidatus Methanofastidiosum methylothiophilum TaxID=1705564 RepID=A0A150IKC6_9EURY|nr:MAG: thymidylate kinase [Candidatus Methanofastidiosum methylthiophilus]KYC46939.1 MAG: thymidylate kinase [Candidatus Methanofastidiosum methylthiophilus]